MKTNNQTEHHREARRDNKQPISKQHTDNQSEEITSQRGGKGEKEEETERLKNQMKQK